MGRDAVMNAFWAVLILICTTIIGSSGICESDYVKGFQCCLASHNVSSTCPNEWVNITSACETFAMQNQDVLVCMYNCSGNTVEDLSCANCSCHNCTYEPGQNCSCDKCYVSPNNTDNSISTKNTDSNTNIIIAASVGGACGVVLIGIIIVLIICCRHRCASNPKRKVISQILQDKTATTQISTTENKEKAASNSSSMPRNYENQKLQNDFSKKIMQQNDTVLRYIKDPTETSAKSNQDSGDQEVYENCEVIAQTKSQDLTNVTALDSMKIEERELAILGPAPKPPSSQTTASIINKDLPAGNHSQEICIDMNVSEEIDYENLNISSTGDNKKGLTKKEQNKPSSIKPKIALKPPKASKINLSVEPVENECDLEDYENTKEFKKSTVTIKNTTNDALAIKNGTSERKGSDSDLEDYENTKDFKKATGPSKKATSEKAKKGTVNKSETIGDDSDAEDYENTGPLKVKTPPKVNDKPEKHRVEIKTGNFNVKPNLRKKEDKTAAAPDKNVINAPVETPYQNITFTRKK